MTFLNPFLLLGLAAAAIPLVIHLFNFRRPRTVSFSSLAFLQEMQKTTMQRVRLRQWLLLLLRTLALACLALAFARPVVEGGFGGAFAGTARTSAVIVVDNTLSMTHRDAYGRYLDQAVAAARGLASQMQPGDEAALVHAGMPGGRAAFYGNSGSVDEALGDLRETTASATIAGLLRAANEALGRAAHLNREVFVLSDFQRSAFADSVQAQLPPDARVYLVPIGARVQANVAVTEVRVASRVVEAGQPLRVEATLVNYGSAPVADYSAGLYVGAERVAQATADAAPGAPTTVSFTFTPPATGWLAGRVELEDDSFLFDNVRHFTLHVPAEQRVLVAAGSGENVQYLQLALSAALRAGGAAYRTETTRGVITSAALGGYDVAALVGPDALSEAEAAALAEYVRGGGGLLFFPGQPPALDAYNRLLAGLGAGRAAGVAAGAARFGRADLEHSLFEGVLERGLEGRAPALESPDIRQALAYQPGPGDEHTLIALSGGQPFLQEVRAGAGGALIFTVGPNPEWSDFPLRGLFVPLMRRAVSYLAGGASVGGEQIVAGAGGEVRVPVASAELLRLRTPGGQELVPEQRPLFGATLVRIDAALTDPGVYDVTRGDSVLRRISVNLAAGESDPRTLSAREAAERLKALSGIEAAVVEPGDLASPGAAVKALKDRRGGVEIWNVFLLLSLLFLTAELILAQYKRAEAVPT